MEESKLEEYNADGSLIDVQWDEVVYDCFVYNSEKIVVLKNEQFDEFINKQNEQTNNQKQFMLGKVYSEGQDDYIFPLSSENYDKALEYYLSLKKAYLGVADDGEWDFWNFAKIKKQ